MAKNMIDRAFDATVRLITHRSNGSPATTWATGFFYVDIERLSGSPRPEVPTDWEWDGKLWLLTNRHVVWKDLHGPPDRIEVVLRDPSYWGMLPPEPVEPVVLGSGYLREHTWVPSPDGDDPDIAAIEIDPTNEALSPLIEWMLDDRDLLAAAPGRIMAFTNRRCLTRDDCHTAGEDFVGGPGDRVLVVGYPIGGVDQVSGVPIAKSGAIATVAPGWEGNTSMFLVDINQFPGSSGSPVISTAELVQYRDHGSGELKVMTLRPTLLGIHCGVLPAQPPGDAVPDNDDHCPGCRCDRPGSSGLGVSWSLPWSFFDAVDPELSPIQLASYER